MPGFDATIVVDAPIEDVFRVVADPTTHPQWSDDELTVEQTGDGTWRTSAVMKGRHFSAELTETVRVAARFPLGKPALRRSLGRLAEHFA